VLFWKKTYAQSGLLIIPKISILRKKCVATKEILATV